MEEQRIDVAWETTAATMPANATATVNGRPLPVLFALVETIDRFRLDGGPIDFPTTKFEPKAFYDRVRAAGGVHMSRFTRTRLGVLDDGTIQYVNATDAEISLPVRPLIRDLQTSDSAAAA